MRTLGQEALIFRGLFFTRVTSNRTRALQRFLFSKNSKPKKESSPRAESNGTEAFCKSLECPQRKSHKNQNTNGGSKIINYNMIDRHHKEGKFLYSEYSPEKRLLRSLFLQLSRSSWECVELPHWSGGKVSDIYGGSAAVGF
jgi:hypothetical protein